MEIFNVRFENALYKSTRQRSDLALELDITADKLEKSKQTIAGMQRDKIDFSTQQRGNQVAIADNELRKLKKQRAEAEKEK